MNTDPCPCGLAADYLQCCGRYIESGISAPTPEALMRSRYSAYVRQKAGYLMKTWHPHNRPDLSVAELQNIDCLGLTVIRSQNGFKKGLVEFRARFRDQNGEHEMHEVSLFQKIKNHWYYDRPDTE